VRSLARGQWGLIRSPKFRPSPPRKSKIFVEVRAKAPFLQNSWNGKAWEQIRCLVSDSARARLTRSRVQGHQRSESIKRHGPRPSSWSKSSWTCVDPLTGIGYSVGGGGPLSFAGYHSATLFKPDRRLDCSGTTVESNLISNLWGSVSSPPPLDSRFAYGPILEPPRRGPSNGSFHSTGRC